MWALVRGARAVRSIDQASAPLRTELATDSTSPSPSCSTGGGASRRRDRAAQRTLTGPHRDELAVTMAGKDQPAADCSTGEQKAMLIAVTLAHASLASRGRPAVLLLDEVAAHLDPLRRAASCRLPRPSQCQCKISCGTPSPAQTPATAAASAAAR